MVNVKVLLLCATVVFVLDLLIGQLVFVHRQRLVAFSYLEVYALDLSPAQINTYQRLIMLARHVIFVH